MFSQALTARTGSIAHHLETVFLFAQNDIRTTLIPVTIFALSAAPRYDPIHAWHAPLWIWFHLLQFNLANQIQDPEEDRKNKPSRPIPAGRISIDSAADMRWVMIPVCLMLSLRYGTQALLASTVFAVFNIWYNELHADKMGLSKNVLTAIIYGCAEVGGTTAVGSYNSRINKVGALAVALSSTVFATTLHAQDFKDEEGDRLTWRRTLPTIFPNAARLSMMVSIPLWSFVLSHVWKLDALSTATFVAYGAYVGTRFVMYDTVGADKQSCKFYSVSQNITWEHTEVKLTMDSYQLWFTLSHLLPGYWCFFYSV
ncbi:UbiA prenyltransferase family-domain-containing protein [Suillus subalutaceus]|uniref:UbiA prenyltransferase family-domain-containing protein n=1 Tax=Suillus subalutaceus TaxID=48586 RepID=UPI001B86173B|nr:UbiA prenyltransferase family-domain-containing protein [Suillus subalutaceus]KAG1841411.1 UbiA prenyltransferase family-domain-containing protein [Suillus subalutaceus]